MTYAPAWQGLAPAALLRRQTSDVLPFPFEAPRVTSFYRARNAIYHLARALEFRRRGPVLCPEYHHGNEIAALRAAGAHVEFYPISRNFEPDLEALGRMCRRGASAVFAIHYLGWPQPLDQIVDICRRHGLILIEDCALSLLSESAGTPLGSRGDFAVFCLYKTLPVPNGGVLVQNRMPLPELEHPLLRSCSPLSVTGRTAELAFEWLRGQSDPIGRILSGAKRSAGRFLSACGARREPIGDTGFSVTDADLAMSSVSHALIRRLDYDSIRERRRANFERLSRQLEGRVRMPRTDLPNGVCPLFFPLLVADKQAASNALLEKGIGNVQFWNQGDPAAESSMSSDVRGLRRQLLEIPIHQGLTRSHIDYIAKQVLALDPHLRFEECRKETG